MREGVRFAIVVQDVDDVYDSLADFAADAKRMIARYGLPVELIDIRVIPASDAPRLDDVGKKK